MCAGRAEREWIRPRSQVVEATAYTIPTERPESDGTLRWDATTSVLVEAAGRRGERNGVTPTRPAAAGSLIAEDSHLR